MRKSLIVVAAGGLALTFAAGCGSQYAMNHNHNTRVGPYIVRPNTVIEAPYGFANVVRICADGDGVYTVHNGTSVEVVASDPACKNAPAGH